MNSLRFVKNLGKGRKCSTTTVEKKLTIGQNLAVGYVLTMIGSMICGGVYGASQELKDVDVKDMNKHKLDKTIVKSIDGMASWGVTVIMSPVLLSGYILGKINRAME